MKKILLFLFISGSLLCSGCSDWLEVYPRNEQITANFWKSKEDVESVLASGYSNLRNCTPTLIAWSELRGASIYAYSDTKQQKLQNFQITASDDLCSWALFYKVLNMANSVIKYAPQVQSIDKTYLEVSMNSHLTEAYFLRGLCYFYLVRNFKEVPLVTEPYVDDSAPYDIAKSSEQDVINQIKADIKTALDTGAAKEFFENDSWEATKGRATKWALYALMADVCLWSEDYEGCIEYADLLINSKAIYRPVFMADPAQWFTIFNPGNSNESIFEINWNSSKYGQTDKSPSSFFTISTSSPYQYTEAMCADLYDESIINGIGSIDASVRAQWGAFVDMNGGLTVDKKQYSIWKYMGTDFKNMAQIRPASDANYIIYRMTDIWLMKAEALIGKGTENYKTALDIINKVRTRAKLSNLDLSADDATELDMMNAILAERNIEFAAEGKRWYDLLRFGRMKNLKYKDDFVSFVMKYNSTANASWLNSTLSNEYAWYLPINQTELDSNILLIQNPYYEGTTN